MDSIKPYHGYLFGDHYRFNEQTRTSLESKKIKDKSCFEISCNLSSVGSDHIKNKKIMNTITIQNMADAYDRNLTKIWN